MPQYQEFSRCCRRSQPDVGEWISGAELLAWHVDVSATIAEDDPLCESETDKTVGDLAVELESLVTRARDRSLGPGDFEGGTFTVMNTGSHGSRSLFGTPIINSPQIGVLGVSGIRNEPVATDERTIAVRKQLYLSLSYDHRLVDGVIAGRFMDIHPDVICFSRGATGSITCRTHSAGVVTLESRPGG